MAFPLRKMVGAEARTLACWSRRSPSTPQIIRHQPCRHIFYSKERGISRDTLVKLQQPFDFSAAGVERWSKRRKLQKLKDRQRVDKEVQQQMGKDLSAAHFVLAEGGAVKFVDSDRWIESSKDGGHGLPHHNLLGYRLEAVDASGTNMMYRSLEHFSGIGLKYLNVSGCPMIDDWCLDWFGSEFKDTLVVLDLSGCSQVTEKGLASLHKLKELRSLQVFNMPSVRHAPFVAILLEEIMPHCVIEGIDSTDQEALAQAQPEEPHLVKHIQQLEHFIEECDKDTRGSFSIVP